MGQWKMNYQEARKWADRYNPHMNQIAAHLLYTNNLMSVEFSLPSLHEDRKQGIDMWVDTHRAKFSYRIRNADAKPYFLDGFTIRTAAKNGKCELEKIHEDGYADFLLYALAHPDKYGEIECAVLIDIKAVGAQLNAFPHLIDNAKKGNGFIEFPYHNFFPYPVVVGTYGVKEESTE
jgi:hypothetical protein